jgi:hypothetical protein
MTLQFKERRQFARKIGDGLVVLIGGRVHPIVDISVSGLSFQGGGFARDSAIRLTLASLQSLEDCVEAQVTIKSVQGGVVRAEFMPTTRLMRYIIAHMGEVTGTKPVYFR